MKDATARRLSRLHMLAYRATGGRVGKRLVNNDMLLLTTHGRKTARSHTVPLLYLRSGSTYVVIASWGGRDYHPDWYLNLLDHPASKVNIRGERRNTIARVAEGSERADWWKRAVNAHDGYAGYQNRTQREIPIVILEPAVVSDI
jgi:deazaflavin-dependent oxidoreductase (nitroreductase family)